MKRDDELLGLLKPILLSHPISTKGDSSNESLFKKISYPDLVEEAETYLNYGDIAFGKNYKKSVRRELFRIKEESFTREIEDIYKKISDSPELESKVLDIVKTMYPDDPNPEVTDIFDETLANSRINNKVIKSKSGDYVRTTTMEATRNELLRQLSDLPYPELQDKVLSLREQYKAFSGKSYKVPATTFKREFVTVRQLLGREIAKSSGALDKISQLDPSYDYRKIADKVGKIENGTLSEQQQSVIEQQVRNLENDVSILRSYEELAVKTDKNPRPPENLSIKDKISFYRRELAGSLDILESKTDVSKTSAAFLDLVEDQKKNNPELYKRTAKKLSQELNFDERRTQNLSNKKVPLTAWKDIEASIKSRRQEIFNPTTSLERFRELLQDPKYRSSLERRIIDGKPAGFLGIEKFDGQYYRTTVDNEQYKSAVASASKPYRAIIAAQQQRIMAARNPVLEEQFLSRVKALTNDGTKDILVDERLNKIFQNFVDINLVDQTKVSDKISATTGVRALKRKAQEMTIKADILSVDPHYNFRSLATDKKDIIASLKEAKKDIISKSLDIRSYEKSGLTVPSRISNLSIKDQWLWWQSAISTTEDIKKMSHPEFENFWSTADQEMVKRALPTNFLGFSNGKVFCQGIDNEYDILTNREKAVLEGSQRKDIKTVEINRFGQKAKSFFGSQEILEQARAVANSQSFSEDYKKLTSSARSVFNRNFGKPVQEDGVFYRTIYDTPSHAAKTLEQDNAIAEKELQEKISTSLRQQTWDFKPKESSISVTPATVATERPKIVEPVNIPEPTTSKRTMTSVNNLLRSPAPVKVSSIGTMGLLGSIALFNVAMSRPSNEVLARRRQLEEERRIKKYGY